MGLWKFIALCMMLELPCHHILFEKGPQVQYMLEFQLLIWA